MAKSVTNERDWFSAVLAIINPALIMGLVGSLAFFLLDVGYRGEFVGQLRWTLFFFVFGAVLVARICILMSNHYGGAYGLALGAATFAACIRYVSGGGALVALFVIVVIAVSAYYITRDCTWMERPDRVAPQGLATEINDLWQLLPTATNRTRKRRHGLTIVWFALAAIPLFGIGQWLIPPEDSARRFSAFQFMTVYLACSLGLLLTTALVSLRSYLQARKLQMPPTMTAVWLATGAVIVLATLAFGALFPRPHGELWSIAGLTAPKRDANQWAPKSEKGGEGEGDPGADIQKSVKAKDGTNNRGKNDEEAKTKTKDGKKGPGGEKKSKEGQGDKRENDPEGQPKDNTAQNPLSHLVSGLQKIIQWIAIIGVVLLILFFLIRGWAGLSKSFRQWLEKLLAKKKIDEPKIESNVASATIARPLPDFHSLTNPFADGSADRRSDAELVQVTFTALEAWGRAHGQTRTADETPIEYARMLGGEHDGVREPAMKLTGHMMRLAFSESRRTSVKLRDDLRELWDCMADNAQSVAPD